MRIYKILFVLFFPVFLLPFCYQNNANHVSEPIRDWLESNAHKVDINPSSSLQDLKALTPLVQNSTLVCLGESRHDIHEQHLLKHKMIKFLIEEQGFRSFILEASFPYAEKINAFIKTGEGDLSEIMAAMPAWFIWDTEEMTDLLEWMHHFNANPDHTGKISFHGIDIVAPNLALDQIFTYLELYNKDLLTELQALTLRRDLFVDDFWPQTRENFSSLGRIEAKSLLNNYRLLHNAVVNHKSVLEQASSKQEFEYIKQLCYNALQACKMFTAESMLDMGLLRDQGMAQNVKWHMDNHPETKHVLWAHNVHIAKSKFKMTNYEAEIEGMGKILSDQLGENMISICGTYNEGNYALSNRRFQAASPNTFESMLSSLGHSSFYLDLSPVSNNDPVNHWLSKEHLIRGQEFEMFCKANQAFDALFFIDEITSVQLNSNSLERLKTLQ